MVFSRLFKSRTEVLKDKIIYTQKNRINSLENEINALKKVITSKDQDVKGVRTNFERSKERLIDQIIELSDKFADISSQMMSISQENAKLKVMVGHSKRRQLPLKEEKKSPKKATKSKGKSRKKK